MVSSGEIERRTVHIIDVDSKHINEKNHYIIEKSHPLLKKIRITQGITTCLHGQAMRDTIIQRKPIIVNVYSVDAMLDLVTQTIRRSWKTQRQYVLS